MTKAFGYAAQDKSTPLAPFQFERRDVGARDLKTIPGGCPAPIRSAISCSPRGVPSEFFILDGGRREVDTT